MADFYGAVVVAIKAKESPVREAIDNAGAHNSVPEFAGCNRAGMPVRPGFSGINLGHFLMATAQKNAPQLG
jgi:hypothetical protein